MKNNTKDLYSKFFILWIGQLFSTIGSGLTVFALGIYVFKQTQSVTSFTMILLSIFLPAFLIKTFAGVFADRFDRRTMMIIGDCGASLGTIFILSMMYYDTDGLWYIYFGIALSSIFNGIQEPAYKASVTDLLSKEQYGKASGLMQLASSSQYLISPFLAGLILFYFNIKTIFIIDIFTFIFAISTIVWVRNVIGKTKINKSNQSFFDDLKDGFVEFYHNKGIVWLVGITMVVLFFVGLLQSLLVPMLLSLVNEKTTGAIQSIAVSGMIVGSLLISIWGSKSGYVKILAISLFLSGIFFSLIGMSTNILFITIAGFFFFGSLPFVNTSIEVLIRKKVDNKKQGRVWSIISVITYLGSIIAFAVSGFLADKIFNPMLDINGVLSQSIGSIIGVGEGRGIGFMFVISGICISIISISLFKNREINRLEI